MIRSMSLNTISCYRSILILFFIALLSLDLEGQRVWTVDQLLDLNLIEDELPYQKNLNFINNEAKGMPFVDRYEFRTETDEMEFERQQYQFRVKFNSSDERKAYDQILSANKDRYSWLQAQFELEVWEERYKNIIDLYFYQKEMDLLGQDLELLSDKKKVLKKILDNETQVDVSEWISNEAEIFDVLSDSLELELKKKGILQKLFGRVGQIIELDVFNFIQIQSINRIVAEVENVATQHPDNALVMAEEKLAYAEYNLELAEANRWLEFAQIQYKSDDDVSFQKEISLGTSITIPYKNNNRVKKNDAALELLEKKYEANIEEEENKKGLFLEEAKIKSLFEQLDDFKVMRENQKLDSMFESFSEDKIVSPLVLIGLKRSILRNAKNQMDIEKDIYESYINILTKKAAFLKVPRINYLKD